MTADGSAASVTYMGIDGNLICNDASACSSLDGKLTGDWYFVATGTDATADLVKKGKVYVPRSEVAYADWGVWIEADSGTGAGSGREIRWHASGNVFGTDNSGNLNLAADTTSGRTLNSATYKGDAHGVSSYGKNVGAFKATASLTATFNDTPMLKGEILALREVTPLKKPGSWFLKIQRLPPLLEGYRQPVRQKSARLAKQTT